MKRKHEKTFEKLVNSYHRNTFSNPGEIETFKIKTGLLTCVSSYSKTFLYLCIITYIQWLFLFRPHIQLRVQLWILTRFPIKPSRHLNLLEKFSFKIISILDDYFLFFNYLYNEHDRLPKIKFFIFFIFNQPTVLIFSFVELTFCKNFDLFKTTFFIAFYRSCISCLRVHDYSVCIFLL